MTSWVNMAFGDIFSRPNDFVDMRIMESKALKYDQIIVVNLPPLGAIDDPPQVLVGEYAHFQYLFRKAAQLNDMRIEGHRFIEEYSWRSRRREPQVPRSN